MTRTVVVWCPDWPLVAAGVADRPSAVLHANRVVACSAAAREEGVRLRQRRREAESACPDVVFLPHDALRDGRAFELVASAVAAFTPEIELTRPGVCSLPARGPARYFGGEEALAGALSAAATAAARRKGEAPPARVGIADTPFAARLAARRGEIVPPGETACWLAPLPVAVLGDPVAEFLRRLGLCHLGEFAEMDEGVVSARLGRDGARAHRLARGLDEEPLLLGQAPCDLSVTRRLDDPIEAVETVAFVAAGLAEELVSRLAEGVLCCTRLLVEASTEHAEESSRWWRADRPMRTRDMVDRVRWQLEGWLSLPLGAPSAGITLIRLTAGEVVPDSGRQLGLLGESAEVSGRLERAVTRVQGLLGHESIGTAVVGGGRAPHEQTRFVPWGDPREAAPSAHEPWPGHIPPPSPTIVYRSSPPVTLEGPDGHEVRVSGRGRPSTGPSRLVLPSGRKEVVTGFVGPWPVDERWWDPALHHRCARMQVVLEDGSAHLLSLEHGSWRLQASYD